MAKAPSISDKINAYYTPGEVIQAFEGNIGKAAAAIAGVPYERGMSKNKAYKAALRGLERQITGQHKPSKPSQVKLARAGRQVAAPPARHITLSGVIRVNGYKRDRTIDFPGSNKQLNADQWDRLADLAASGDDSGVWSQMATIYGGSVWEIELESGTIDVE